VIVIIAGLLVLAFGISALAILELLDRRDRKRREELSFFSKPPKLIK
jgi:predicted outer membrane lipoprotein